MHRYTLGHHFKGQEMKKIPFYICFFERVLFLLYSYFFLLFFGSLLHFNFNLFVLFSFLKLNLNAATSDRRSRKWEPSVCSGCGEERKSFLWPQFLEESIRGHRSLQQARWEARVVVATGGRLAICNSPLLQRVWINECLSFCRHRQLLHLSLCYLCLQWQIQPPIDLIWQICAGATSELLFTHIALL